MVVIGAVVGLPFGVLGGFMALDARGVADGWAALKEMLGAVLFLALAAYGGWLCWRGLRGYSRPTAQTHRLLFVAAALLAVAGMASFLSMIVRVVIVGPVVIQHAAWHSLNGTAWYSAMMSLALPFQLAAHELGHIAAGRWVGFEFLSIQVGPFRFDRPSDRWRVMWQPLAFGLGGRATMIFHGNHRLPQRSAVFAAGGPAANLLLTLLTGALAAASPSPRTATAAVAVGVLNGCAAEGVLLFVVNLLPIRGTGTDGARILQALWPRTKPVEPERRPRTAE